MVDDSTRVSKLRTTNLKAGESIVMNSIIIGNTFTNVGNTDLHRNKTPGFKTSPPAIETIPAGVESGTV